MFVSYLDVLHPHLSISREYDMAAENIESLQGALDLPILKVVALAALKVAGILALGWGASTAVGPAARAEQGADAAAALVNDIPVVLPPYVVSATRIERNPWRYASLPGFEVLSRASAADTSWWLDALQRGRWLENEVMPTDWLPEPPVPYTVIIDDTNLKTVRSGQLHSQPIEFRSPVDAMTWGRLSEKATVWTARFGAHDDDTFASNINVYDVNPRIPAYGSISLERVFRCTPPLPRWLIAGLLGNHCGIFRESFMPIIARDGSFSRIGIDINSGGLIQKAMGPGTLWVSLDETQRLLLQIKKDKKAKIQTRIAIPPLGGLFSEAPPADESLPLWESEAGLFVRWGLMGPGRNDPVMSVAFLELVRRARREPVTERMFADCFGFGYAAMEGRLESFLKAVLAQPNSIDLDFPSSFSEADLKAATADQIGRILGDWLRMEGGSLRQKDPGLSEELLYSAGRMLLRAYKNDNGLPPDVDTSHTDERPARPPRNAARGPVVAMEPFVVTAAHIHDPGLLAVYGLYEHDIGNSAKAREFLEKAVEAGVVRPRACIVLAGLRYAEAVGQPAGSAGKISVRQAALILEPLRAALRSSASSDIYSLIVATWAHCEAKPTEDDADKMVEGVARFPRNTLLAYRSALVCAQSGYAAKAAELIDRGLLFATDESKKDFVGRLRSALAAPVIPDTKQPNAVK